MIHRYLTIFSLLLILFASLGCAEKPNHGATSYGQQSLHLKKGWNTTSFYVHPTKHDSLLEVLAPVEDQLNQILGYVGRRGGAYRASAILNEPDQLELNRAYLIEMKDSATLKVEGRKEIADQVDLFSKVQVDGEMYVGYFPIPGDTPIHVADLLYTSPEDVIAIHEYQGGTFVPEYYFNTINVLMPGKSYLFFFRDSLTIASDPTMPFSEKDPYLKVKNEDLPESFIPRHPHPIQMLLMIPHFLVPEIDMIDYVAAYTPDGICAGVQVIDHEEDYTVLSLYSDDFSVEGKEGFIDGEEIHLRFLDIDRSNMQYAFEIIDENDLEKYLHFTALKFVVVKALSPEVIRTISL